IKAIKESAEVNDVTIVEGLMVYWKSVLYNLFTCRIFIELDKEEFFRRKQTDLRWGKEPKWYMEYIWDSYLIYGQAPSTMKIDFILDGKNGFDVADVYSKIANS
ncbi:MAG: hypothetical protein J7L96_02840, partial [Bacteroidales bacterium]|nr:hypothetical protein [Bacteroidales bacterium]